jgi:tyrosyl-tRNA synthetase
MRQETVFGITFPLITTSSGAKMGKTAKGAIWLDSERTSPYEYYQYWINTDDNDIVRFLALYTFLPMNEIRDVEKLEDDDLNSAKTVLAFEATQLLHGRQEAIKAYHAAASMFGIRIVPERIMPKSSIPRDEADFDDISVPHSFFDLKQIQAGIPAFKLFHLAGLAPSGSAAMRLIKQGGAYINGNRISSTEYMISENDLNNKEILLRAGKKRFHKIKIRC